MVGWGVSSHGKRERWSEGSAAARVEGSKRGKRADQGEAAKRWSRPSHRLDEPRFFFIFPEEEIIHRLDEQAAGKGDGETQPNALQA